MDHAIARHAKGSIADGVGVVWGSERPWVEVLLARHGAKRVLTVEYGRIKVDEHPFISATTPSQFAAMMLTHPRSFDFAVTYSSFEHSGLGRYGDSLNPWGDIEAAVQTWCLLRPGGIFCWDVSFGLEGRACVERAQTLRSAEARRDVCRLRAARED